MVSLASLQYRIEAFGDFDSSSGMKLMVPWYECLILESIPVCYKFKIYLTHSLLTKDEIPAEIL